MLTCVLGEASCERSLAFVFLSKNKSVIPGEVFDPPRPSFAKEGAFRFTPSLLCQRGVFCPTCPSPAGGSLIPNQAFPLTIKGKDVTALRCSEPLRSKVGGASKPSPYFAGWDRLGTARFFPSPCFAGWDRLGTARFFPSPYFAGWDRLGDF